LFFFCVTVFAVVVVSIKKQAQRFGVGSRDKKQETENSVLVLVV
jgi:hypothetical protein